MKVSVKDQGKTEKLLTIQVPTERVKSEYDKVYAEIAKTARIPGFRPGKAPKEIVAAHYKEDAKEHVLKNLIHETTFEAIEKEKIDALYYPSINKVDFDGNTLAFEAVVELRPEVKLGAYKGIKVKKEAATVDEKAFDETLDRIRESYAKFVPEEGRGVKEGDFLVSDMDVVIDGKTVDSRKDDWFEMNPKRAQADLVKGLVGMKTGETREIQVPFPKDFPVKEYAGKTGTFKVSLKEIKRRELPEVTEEWVKGLGEFQTVEEFKKHVREDLLKQKEHELGIKFENDIMEVLLKESKCELPSSAIERRVGYLVEDSKKRLQYQGLSAEQIQGREADLKKELLPEAEKQLKLAFIFDAIAKAEKLVASEADFEAKCVEMAEKAKVSVEKVKVYYGTEEKRDNLMNQLQNDKVLKFLKDNAKTL